MRHPGGLFSIILSASLLLSACSFGSGVSEARGITQMDALNGSVEPGATSNAAYEIFVGSFCDSDGDGIGDINGIRSRLSYISGMGFDMIWLTPVCKSPTYHKYDVEDYCEVDPQFGTMQDFETLVSECHDLGISVITDFVMNHTSSSNEWFIEACDAVRSSSSLDEAREECPFVDYYKFSDESAGGFVNLSGTDYFYEAQFWSEMPDLNLNNPAVRSELEDIASFWLDRGVDGFRLDATTYYVSGSDSSNIEILTWFNDYVKSVLPEAYIVCEAWTDSASYLPYYQSGVDGVFNFDFSGKSGVTARVAGGLSPASSYGSFTEDYYSRMSSLGSVTSDLDAPFYTNHDMGRSAGYFAGDDAMSMTKLAGALNLLMSGRVFVYYGEELGMKGSGKDENFRAPMYWCSDASSSLYPGMCDGPSGMDAFEMKYPSFEEQEEDPLSVYNYYRQAVLLRSRFPVISSGEFVFYDDLSDDCICVIEKVDPQTDEAVLIVINTSSDSRDVDLSGTDYGGGSLAAVLAVSYDEASLRGGTLEIPGYFIAVIGK